LEERGGQMAEDDTGDHAKGDPEGEKAFEEA